MTTKQQSGFGVMPIIVIVAAVAVLGFVGYKVYTTQSSKPTTNNQTSPASSQPSNSQASATPATQTDPYAGWKTYTSTIGNFSLKYPSDWYFNSGSTVSTPEQISLEPTSSQSSTTNAFRMTLWVRNAPLAASSAYSNGTTQKLTNGLTLWQEKQDIALATGSSTATCPNMQIGTDNTYSFQLKNGKYLTLSASYCEAERDTVNLSYQQQVASQAWQDAIKVIQFITLN